MHTMLVTANFYIEKLNVTLTILKIDKLQRIHDIFAIIDNIFAIHV